MEPVVNGQTSSASEKSSAIGSIPNRPLLQRSQRQQLTVATLTSLGSVGLMVVAATVGQAPWLAVIIWAPLALAVNLFTWLGLKFSWTRAWRDPALTTPQIASAIASCAAVYAMLGPLRGVALPMLALAFQFAIFALPARTVRWLTLWTLGLFGVVMMAMSHWQPQRYPPLEEAIYFGVLILSVPPMALLAARLSELRARLGRQKAELEQALQRISLTAERDELTGLFNRRRIGEELQAQLARAQRDGTPFAVAMVDIDHFKGINDLHGHAGGDAMLRSFAQAAGASLRAVDVLGRWGGEEFLVVLSSEDAAGAMHAAERLRRAISALEVELPGGARARLTVSIGLACWQGGESIEQLTSRADRALYSAKSGGRDRVVLG